MGGKLEQNLAMAPNCKEFSELDITHPLRSAREVVLHSLLSALRRLCQQQNKYITRASRVSFAFPVNGRLRSFATAAIYATEIDDRIMGDDLRGPTSAGFTSPIACSKVWVRVRRSKTFT